MYLPIFQHLVLVLLVSAVSIGWYRFIAADLDESPAPALSLLLELLYGLLAILVVLAAAFVAGHLLFEKPLVVPKVAWSIWGYALLMVVAGPIWQWRTKVRSPKQSEHSVVTQIRTFAAARQHFSQAFFGRRDATWQEIVTIEEEINRKRISLKLFRHPNATWEEIFSHVFNPHWSGDRESILLACKMIRTGEIGSTTTHAIREVEMPNTDLDKL